jgi:2-iminoacetate synthase
MSVVAGKAKLSASGCDFIDEARLGGLLDRKADAGEVRDVIAKSLSKTPLEVEETAALLAAEEPALVEQIFDAARQLKRDVYGNRIVLFAPLYVGSECTNDCQYCAFRRSNRQSERISLDGGQLAAQVEALLAKGHKRTILVFGEHPRYSPEFIADCVRQVYAVGLRGASIRRVNINAAPMDHAGYAAIKASAIGTFQIFQETYHHATYAAVHPPKTRKADYLWRLDGVARAMESGLDDVGIGALFGLYDWRFEVLGLVSHALHLSKHHRVGPHTISFPRLRPASGVSIDRAWQVSDHDFKRLIAVLRLSVPYTGLICTAREPAALRREVMAFGISQIDAGSRIELGGYTQAGDAQVMEREQFQLGDVRPLDAVLQELITDGYIPSFCTACYRLGRTGEHFMEFAIPGFIQNMCTPNALTTLMEYLVDYAAPETMQAARQRIVEELAKIPEGQRKRELVERLERIEKTDARDLYF